MFEAFGPDPDMQIYGRGLRRRIPSMLDGDPRRIRMVYSLLFSLPGTPVLFYGEEIGMGELRPRAGTPSGPPCSGPTAATAGSPTPPSRLWPTVQGGFGPEHVSVAAQRQDPDSLLRFMTLLDAALPGGARAGLGDVHGARSAPSGGARPHGEHRRPRHDRAPQPRARGLPGAVAGRRPARGHAWSTSCATAPWRWTRRGAPRWSSRGTATAGSGSSHSATAGSSETGAQGPNTASVLAPDERRAWGRQRWRSGSRAKKRRRRFRCSCRCRTGTATSCPRRR